MPTELPNLAGFTNSGRVDLVVFSFTRSYFLVDARSPSQVVSFLRGILPRKPEHEPEPLEAVYLFLQEPASQERREQRLQPGDQRRNPRRHAEMDGGEYPAQIASLEQHPCHQHVAEAPGVRPGRPRNDADRHQYREHHQKPERKKGGRLSVRES